MLSREAARRCVRRQWQQQRTPTWSSSGTAPPPPARSTASVTEKSEAPASLRHVLQRLRESVRGSDVSCSVSVGGRRAERGLLEWYLGMIEARPIVTKSVTASAIFAAADVSSQMITKKFSDSFDFKRTVRMAGYGMLVLGPTLHLWFNFISRILPKRDVISTMKKIFIGQTVFGPIMTATFFSINAVLQGESRTEIVARMERDLFPTIRNGLVYWPLADFIMFKFIPVRLQPVICNTFSFFWTIYLTQIASSKKAHPDKIPALQDER